MSLSVILTGPESADNTFAPDMGRHEALVGDIVWLRIFRAEMGPMRVKCLSGCSEFM